MTEAVDMSPEAVGKRIVDDWLDGTDQNTLEELQAAIVHLGKRLGSLAELIYDDEAVGVLANSFRDAADAMETDFGERLRRGVRHRMTLQKSIPATVSRHTPRTRDVHPEKT